MATLKVTGKGNIEIVYKVMPIENIQASHCPNHCFIKNEKYPYENERRYHAEKDSQAKVLNQALTLDPDYLLDNRTAIDGAPIIDNKGNVLGGNGRSMAIMVAYDKNTHIIANYIATIKDYADDMGIGYADINKPILVREIKKDLSKNEAQELIAALNQNGTQALDARSQARSRGLKLSEKLIHDLSIKLPEYDTIRAFFDSPESRQTVDLIIDAGIILDTEKIQYIDSQGYLNSQGKTFVEAALRAHIFTSYESLSRLPASIITKLDACLPFIMACKNVKNWDISDYLIECFDLFFEYITNPNQNLSIFLSSSNMITGKAPIDRYSLISQILFINFLIKTKKELVDLFKNYKNQCGMSIENGLKLIYGKPYNEARIDLLNIPAQILQDNAYRICENNIIKDKDYIFDKKSVLITVNNQYNKTGNNSEFLQNNTCIDNTENADELINIELQAIAASANSVNIEQDKTVKTKRGKNDCTKQNSSLICSNTDKAQLIELASLRLQGSIELLPISKTQNKVILNGNEAEGYRIIYSGKYWQLRILNEFMSTTDAPLEINSAPEKTEALKNLTCYLALEYAFCQDYMPLPEYAPQATELVPSQDMSANLPEIQEVSQNSPEFMPSLLYSILAIAAYPYNQDCQAILFKNIAQNWPFLTQKNIFQYISHKHRKTPNLPIYAPYQAYVPYMLSKRYKITGVLHDIITNSPFLPVPGNWPLIYDRSRLMPNEASHYALYPRPPCKPLAIN